MTVIEDIGKLTEQTVGGLRVESVTEDQATGINMLVYGDSGVGKTVFAGSASAVPELSPVLSINVEGGNMSLQKTYPHVKALRVKKWDDLQAIYDDLYVSNPYKTIVIDSLSELQRFSMDQIMADVVKKDDERDPDVPAQRDWGKNQNQIRFFVRAFRDLPCNVIFTALATEVQDKRSGIWKTKPSLPGKLANEITAFLDIVVFYYIKRHQGNDLRLMLTKATDAQVAKDRSGSLPQIIGEEAAPTMADIYRLINMSPVTDNGADE